MNPQITQLDFDFTVTAIVGPKRELLNVFEVCKILGYERSKIYELAQEGKLEVHRDPTKDKSHIRFTRRSVTVFLLRSAQYHPKDIVGDLLSVTRTLTTEQRRDLVVQLGRQTSPTPALS